MSTPQRSSLSFLDYELSRDAPLSNLTELFASQVKRTELIEPPVRPTPTRRHRLRAVVCTPEFLTVTAVLILATCALVGGLLNSGVIALCGLAAPVLLAVGGYVATRNHRKYQKASASRR
ncbi:MAG TPA: hypothetical protein VHU85_13245 [Acidimicrobiales bacterium]|nr:hypothetical protein [Acidimicrobiales bacterium]